MMSEIKNQFSAAGAYQQAYSALVENTAPGHSGSGALVNVDSALGLAAVWEAVQMISGHIAGLPLNVMRRQGEGAEVARQHPIQKLFNDKPNYWQTPFMFRELLMMHALFQGNGRALIVRNKLGQPIGLQPLYPWYTYTYILEMQKFHVTYTHPYYPGFVPPSSETGNLVAHADEDVLHIPGLTYNGFWGIHLVQAAKEVLGQGISAQERANASFLNTGMPGFLIEVPHVWNAQQRAEFKRDWDKNYAGSRNAGKMQLLPEGFKAHAAHVTAQDAQLAELNSLSNEQIRRLFLLPPEGPGPYKSITERNTQYINTCLARWFQKWTQEIRLKMMSERERLADSHFLEFDTSRLISGDPNQLAEYTGKLRQQGLISGNEARQMHNLNPVNDPALEEYSNPNISTPGDDDGTAPEADDQASTDTVTDEAQARARVAVQMHFANLIENEKQLLTRRAGKDKDFAKFVDDYYPKQQRKLLDLCSKLNLPGELAKEHCSQSVDQLQEITSTTPADQLPAAVATLTQSWSGRAARFVRNV